MTDEMIAGCESALERGQGARLGERWRCRRGQTTGTDVTDSAALSVKIPAPMSDGTALIAA